MRIVPAHINQEGIETVYTLGEHPTMLDSSLGSLAIGFAGFDQFYIPGISVPGHTHLERPFYVPVIGDAEPISLQIDTANMDAEYVKRVTFIGMLIAESIAVEPPLPDREPFLGNENLAALAVDEAFDDLCGDGGFLRVTAISAYAPGSPGDQQPLLHGADEYDIPPLLLSGEAELYLFEGTDEFMYIKELLRTGRITPIDILAHMRAAKSDYPLGKQYG